SGRVLGVAGRSLSAHVLEDEGLRGRWGRRRLGRQPRRWRHIWLLCSVSSTRPNLARAQNLMKPSHTLPASPRSPPTVAARTRTVSVAASCTRACELSLRSRFGDDLLVEPPHAVDSERGEIEVDRFYPELAHGAQVVDDLGVAAGEQEPLSVVGLRTPPASVALDLYGERD